MNFLIKNSYTWDLVDTHYCDNGGRVPYSNVARAIL